METYSSDMNDALQQYGHCLLPDIGLLYITRNPAFRSYQDHKIYPPAYEISLLPLTGKEDKFYSITQQISFSHSLAEEEAVSQWQATSITIRTKLSTGSSFELLGIGLLNLDNDRQITLDAANSFWSVYQPVPFGEIKSFSLPKPESNIEPPAVTDSPKREKDQQEKSIPPVINKREKRRREMASWWIAATIIALLLVGWLTYKGTLKRNEKMKSLNSIISGARTKRMAKRDSLKLSEDSVAQENAMRHDSIHYTIVFAVYNNKEKAMHQYHKMKGWGHPVVLLSKDTSTYELGMPFTTLPEDTTVSLVSMMKLYGDKVHIEYGSAVSK
ncbi:MAG: hypothetical protein ACRDE2_08920 [Chitinophagaceae bacterium]